MFEGMMSSAIISIISELTVPGEEICRKEKRI